LAKLIAHAGFYKHGMRPCPHQQRIHADCHAVLLVSLHAALPQHFGNHAEESAAVEVVVAVREDAELEVAKGEAVHRSLAPLCGMYAQMALEVVLDEMEQMGTGGRAGYAVGLARINHKIELLASIDQRVHELHRVLEVNVIVSSTVRQQQAPVELLSKVNRRTCPISLRILLWQAHIAFGVNGIVIQPVGDRRNRNAGFESVGVSQGVRSHEAAVAPSPPAEPSAVKNGKLREDLVKRRQLIFEFDSAEMMAHRRREFLTAAAHAAIVNNERRKASLRHELVEEKMLSTPFVRNVLRVWSSVGVHDQRNTAGRTVR